MVELPPSSLQSSLVERAWLKSFCGGEVEPFASDPKEA